MTKMTATTSRYGFGRYQPIALKPAMDKITETPVPIDVLIDILGYRRDGGSPGEEAMIAKYITPLDPEQDTYGNLFVVIPKADGSAPHIAFTAHTDSVHRDILPSAKGPGMMDERQTVTVSADGLIASVENGDCLGADDGTGIWLLLNLLEAKVPGLYCFFRDEEVGRRGSEWSARHQASRYSNIKIMISFDRAGTTDIITHQMSERCCSEVFAERLGTLIDPSGELIPDDTGSFTDSYSFIDMIPECTNVSVGYKSQHTSSEQQDLSWASFLASRLIRLDWDSLPVERNPEDIDESVSISDLIEAFPLDMAEVLDQYGFEAKDFLRELADLYSCRPADIALRVSYQRYSSYRSSTATRGGWGGYYDDHYDFEATRDDPTDTGAE